MLAYARGGRYQPRKCNLNESVMEVIRLHDLVDPERANLDLQISPDLWEVTADTGQMAMILMSLISNALEAMEQRGTIEVTTSNARVKSGGRFGYPYMKKGRYVVLEVRDSGSGMDPATLSRVFEPFFSTKFRGRGLGLAAVYGIVKNHGGYITADSEAGRGSVFRVYLPAIEERGTSAEIPERDQPSRTAHADLGPAAGRHFHMGE